MTARQFSSAEKPAGTSRASARLQRKCACGTHTHDGGTCRGCGSRTSLQSKLVIGRVDDPFEAAADRIAAQVLALPEAAVPPATRGHRQAAPGWPSAYPVDAAPGSVGQVLACAGHPMPEALRQDMEQRFDHDFSRVRVHDDASAGRSARGMNARAYTVGNNIVFAAGRYAPATGKGRQLLAHELAHVVQQSAAPAPIVRRAPDAGVDAPTDAGPVVDAPAASDAGTADSATAAPVMPTRVPANEDEAREDTDKAFPTDADVSSSIASLPEVVRKELGSDAAYQRKFLYRTSMYLGPHPAPIEHYRNIGTFTFADRTVLHLHADAIAHLDDVQSVIGAADMPSSGTGFALRHLIRQADVPPPGLMVHAVGYAIDFRAALNPHFKDARLVAVQALYTPDAASFRMATGQWATRRGTIKKMGRGELAEDAKERKDFIARFRVEGAKDLQGNVAITNALAASDLATLKALRGEYKQFLVQRQGYLKGIAAGRRKLKKGQAFEPGLSDIAEGLLLLHARHSIIERTRAVLHDLSEKADAGIRSMKAAPHVAETDKDYAAALGRLAERKSAARRAEGSTARELARAAADLRGHTRVLERLKSQIRTARSGRRRTRLESQEQVETEAQSRAFGNVLAGTVRHEMAARAEASASASLDEAKAAKGKRRWLGQLDDLQRGLSDDHFDARLVFGIGDKDAEADKAVRDPSLIQLFSKGFFNVDPPLPPPAPSPTGSKRRPRAAATRASHGFDLRFMEEMAKHGFDQGSEWEPGGVDSMHFEYAEGVDKLHRPTDAKSSSAKAASGSKGKRP